MTLQAAKSRHARSWPNVSPIPASAKSMHPGHDHRANADISVPATMMKPAAKATIRDGSTAFIRSAQRTPHDFGARRSRQGVDHHNVVDLEEWIQMTA